MSWIDDLLGYKDVRTEPPGEGGGDGVVLPQRSRFRVEGSLEASDDSSARETVLTVAEGAAEFTEYLLKDNESGSATLAASILHVITLTAASPTYTLASVTADPTLIGKAIRVLFIDVGSGTITFAVAGGDTLVGGAVSAPVDGTSIVFRAYAGKWFVESRKG